MTKLKHASTYNILKNCHKKKSYTFSPTLLTLTLQKGIKLIKCRITKVNANAHEAAAATESI